MTLDDIQEWQTLRSSLAAVRGTDLSSEEDEAFELMSSRLDELRSAVGGPAAATAFAAPELAETPEAGRADAVASPAEVAAAIAEYSVVRLRMVDGTNVEGSLRHTQGIPWVQGEGGDVLVLGSSSSDLERVQSIETVRSGLDVLAEREVRRYGEQAYVQPITRDEYERVVWELALTGRQAEALRVATSRDDPNYRDYWVRATQLEAQFDRVADEIALAKTKRRYVWFQAGRRAAGEPLVAPSDLGLMPNEESLYDVPKPSDFDPDPVQRRKRSLKPAIAYPKRAAITASLRAAQNSLRHDRLRAEKRAMLERIVTQRERQMERGLYREAVEALERGGAEVIEAGPQEVWRVELEMWEEDNLDEVGRYVGEPLVTFPYPPGARVPVTDRYSAMLNHQAAVKLAEKAASEEGAASTTPTQTLEVPESVREPSGTELPSPDVAADPQIDEFELALLTADQMRAVDPARLSRIADTLVGHWWPAGRAFGVKQSLGNSEGRVRAHRAFLRNRFNNEPEALPYAVLVSHATEWEWRTTSREFFSRQAAVRERNYRASVEAVELPEGVLDSVQVPTASGAFATRTGTRFGGLLVHQRIDPGGQSIFHVTHVGSGVRVSGTDGFPHLEAAITYVRSLLHAEAVGGLPMEWHAKSELAPAQASMWRDLINCGTGANRAVPSFFVGALAKSLDLEDATPPEASIKPEAAVIEPPVSSDVALEAPSHVRPVEPPRAKFDAVAAKRMKDALLAALDQAIGAAPEESEPHPEIAGELRRVDSRRYETRVVDGEEYRAVVRAESDEAIAWDVEDLMEKYSIPQSYGPAGYWQALDGTMMPKGPEKAGEYPVGFRVQALREQIALAAQRSQYVEICVPGSPKYRLVNKASVLKEFRKTFQGEFPVQRRSADRYPSLPRGTAEPLPPLKKPKTTGDYLKAAALFTSTDATRFVLTYVHSDGKQLVATDGRRMVVIDHNAGGTAKKPLWLNRKTLKTEEVEGKYPEWRNVLPSSDREDLAIECDTEELSKQLNALEPVCTERSEAVFLWQDASGKLGLVTVDAAAGDSVATAMDFGSAVPLAALKAAYVQDVLRTCRALGHEKVTLRIQDQMCPVTFHAKGLLAVVMPMRMNDAQANHVHPLAEKGADERLTAEIKLLALAMTEVDANAHLARETAQGRNVPPGAVVALWRKILAQKNPEALRAARAAAEPAPPSPAPNMAGKERAPLPAAKPTPVFLKLPPKSQEKFNAAWAARSAEQMKELLRLENRGLRAEFEARAAIKLVTTLRGTAEQLTQWEATFAEAPLEEGGASSETSSATPTAAMPVEIAATEALTHEPATAAIETTAAANPGDESQDTNIGRTWKSPYGTQRIVSVLGGGTGDLFCVITEETGEERRYSADRIEEVIQRDTFALSPAYALEVVEREEMSRLRKEHDEKQAAKLAAEKAQITQFTSGMQPLEAARKEKALLTRRSFKGSISTTNTFVQKAVSEGYSVSVEDGERRLLSPDGNTFWSEAVLSKTAMDYAVHLLVGGTAVEAPFQVSESAGPSKPEWMSEAEYGAHQLAAKAYSEKLGDGVTPLDAEQFNALGSYEQMMAVGVLRESGSEIPAYQANAVNAFATGDETGYVLAGDRFVLLPASETQVSASGSSAVTAIDRLDLAHRAFAGMLPGLLEAIKDRVKPDHLTEGFSGSLVQMEEWLGLFRDDEILALVKPAEEPSLQRRRETAVPVEATAEPDAAMTRYPALDPGVCAVINKRYTRSLRDLRTGAMTPTLSAESFKGGVSAVWMTQEHVNSINFNAHVRVAGEPPPEYAVRQWESIVQARKAGFEATYYRASGYQGVRVLQRGDDILTKAGAAALLSGIFDFPRHTEGTEKYVTGFAGAFSRWLATLPESTLESPSAFSTKLGGTPWRDRVKLEYEFATQPVLVLDAGADAIQGQFRIHTTAAGLPGLLRAVVALSRSSVETHWASAGREANEAAKAALIEGKTLHDVLRAHGYEVAEGLREVEPVSVEESVVLNPSPVAIVEIEAPSTPAGLETQAESLEPGEKALSADAVEAEEETPRLRRTREAAATLLERFGTELTEADAAVLKQASEGMIDVPDDVLGQWEAAVQPPIPEVDSAPSPVLEPIAAPRDGVSEADAALADRIRKYQERREARIDRLRDGSRNVSRNADDLHRRAHRMADVIPFGQPIMVGHHSEGRDRSYRSRIGSTFERSFALSAKAERLAARADAAESNTAIFSDDPEAPTKIQDRIQDLKQKQETMKAANACVRRNDLAGLRQLGFSEKQSNDLVTGADDVSRRKGFPAYMLSNNNAQIRRLEERLEQVNRAATQESRSEEHAGITIKDSVEDNRLRLRFPGKPDEAMRMHLKRHGFRWSPTESAWQRHRSPNGDQFTWASWILDAVPKETPKQAVRI